MSAPKKIWVDVLERDIATWEWEGGTPYIRADIVDGLVEALKDAKCWRSRGVHRFSIVPKIEAALAKLEESHD